MSPDSLPNDKLLEKSKLKAFADDKLKMIKIARFVLDKIENIMGKEENADYQHFLFFPTMFSKDFFFSVVKNQDCVVNS